MAVGTCCWVPPELLDAAALAGRLGVLKTLAGLEEAVEVASVLHDGSRRWLQREVHPASKLVFEDPLQLGEPTTSSAAVLPASRTLLAWCRPLMPAPTTAPRPSATYASPSKQADFC